MTPGTCPTCQSVNVSTSLHRLSLLSNDPRFGKLTIRSKCLDCEEKFLQIFSIAFETSALESETENTITENF